MILHSYNQMICWNHLIIETTLRNMIRYHLVTKISLVVYNNRYGTTLHELKPATGDVIMTE